MGVEEEMEEKEERKEEHDDKKQKQKQKHAKVGFGGGERVKRDEWSEGAVSTLLEAYEAKWVLRNRAKLKGHDWEEVARHVSARANCTKTSTQCKNKVESMKKRYRSESPHASSWPLYSRLHLLLTGTPPPQSPSQPPPLPNAQNSHGSSALHHILPKEDGLATKSSEDVSSKNPLETDSSTPALYKKKEGQRCNKRKNKKIVDVNTGRRRKEYVEIAESLRWLAEAMVRSEQARMDTMKEIERMRVEAEAKRWEMDLKRTEIIANTQLEIARIFASVNNNNNKGVDSSLRIGKS